MQSNVTPSPRRRPGSIRPLAQALKWIPAFAGMTFLLLTAIPAFAADYNYAPEDCEFRAVLPGEPYHSRRCDPDNPNLCRDMTSYTKVFGIDASINVNLTCNKAEDQMYEKYNGDIMQATLSTMLGENKLDEYQTGYQEFDVAKQAVLLGTGTTGNNEKLFIAQLWIGHKSVLSVEAELIGMPVEEADAMFSTILKSIRHESWAEDGTPNTPEKPATELPAADAAPQEEKTPKKP